MENATSSEEKHIHALFDHLLKAWNDRDAHAFAALYEENGSQVGFDGSQVNGSAEIEANLREIFASHMTATYVAIVREVRFLNDETALLRAVAGMLPRGSREINPATNAIQSLVAVRRNGNWKIALFHNTPAAFHGRPQASPELTAELQKLITQ